MLFIENVGQFTNAVRFQAQSRDGTLFFTEEAIWLMVHAPVAEECFPPGAYCASDKDILSRGGVNLKLSFSGANPQPRIVGLTPIETTISYHAGQYPNAPQWLMECFCDGFN
jgi:hypothetical protein